MYYNLRRKEERKKEEFLRIINREGKYMSVKQQVFNVNGEIFRMRKLCRNNNVKLENYQPFQELMEEATKRYTMHGYIYDGNRFINKYKNNIH